MENPGTWQGAERVVADAMTDWEQTTLAEGNTGVSQVSAIASALRTARYLPADEATECESVFPMNSPGLILQCTIEHGQPHDVHTALDTGNVVLAQWDDGGDRLVTVRADDLAKAVQFAQDVWDSWPYGPEVTGRLEAALDAIGYQS